MNGKMVMRDLMQLFVHSCFFYAMLDKGKTRAACGLPMLDQCHSILDQGSKSCH